MRVKAAFLSATFMVLLGGHAGADTIDLLRSGQWDAFGGTDVGGHEVCGVSTHWPDGRSFLVKRYEGDNYVVIQAINPDWHITSDHIGTSLTIGNNSAWTANSSVMEKLNGVEFSVSILKSVDFMDEFSSSNSMVLEMGENHVTWTVGLDGSQDVAKKFSDCVKVMSK